ncbi:A/G-specific DNA-adenine glycosylase [Novosphingobium kunmingense]|uniref:Adenine DNA glycosylase n=1 Tax=Novosphingobium kunmingense TaxID=1211806 RepID=A0A2N0I454_9SPHN|nr:A/G-specific adenine glycosylase [Novosphingobium kunmingense]PKB25936.1 A/G-specific DNA-adenine glycosylase [Novosphingobium kunmingense]
MDASAETVRSALLAWYDDHARRLPWRSPPGSPPPDPYRVWLSEVMLQQTTTAAVAPYYAKFLDRWPRIEDLAAAEDGDVMAAWAGLGYYARARNLLACARAVAARGGAFPATEAGLRALPGLGTYTAASVAAIAFGEAATVVDANVERVVARLFAIEEPLPAARKAIRAAAETLTPDERPGDFAQAMMDLGATICTARSPRCLLCPLADYCRGRTQEPERFPVKPARKARPLRSGRAWWVEAGGKVFLVTRPGKGMLGGMRALPDDGWSARGDGDHLPPLDGPWRHLGTVRHGFSHFDLDLQLMLYSGDNCSRLSLNGEWWPLDRIDDAGLPTLFARAARFALADQGEDQGA